MSNFRVENVDNSSITTHTIPDGRTCKILEMPNERRTEDELKFIEDLKNGKIPKEIYSKGPLPDAECNQVEFDMYRHNSHQNSSIFADHILGQENAALRMELEQLRQERRGIETVLEDVEAVKDKPDLLGKVVLVKGLLEEKHFGITPEGFEELLLDGNCLILLSTDALNKTVGQIIEILSSREIDVFQARAEHSASSSSSIPLSLQNDAFENQEEDAIQHAPLVQQGSSAQRHVAPESLSPPDAIPTSMLMSDPQNVFLTDTASQLYLQAHSSQAPGPSSQVQLTDLPFFSSMMSGLTHNMTLQSIDVTTSARIPPMPDYSSFASLQTTMFQNPYPSSQFSWSIPTAPVLQNPGPSQPGPSGPMRNIPHEQMKSFAADYPEYLYSSSRDEPTPQAVDPVPTVKMFHELHHDPDHPEYNEAVRTLYQKRRRVVKREQDRQLKLDWIRIRGRRREIVPSYEQCEEAAQKKFKIHQ